MKQEIIPVQNMKCSGCVNSIAQLFGAFPEVQDLKIDLEEGTVFVTSTEDDQRAKYEATLTRAGYPPVGSDNPLSKKAKSYISCAIGRVSKN